MKLVLILSLMTALTHLARGQDAPKGEFISLDGKPVAAGNPIDPNPNAHLILHVKDAVLWLFRTKAANPAGTVLLCPGGAYVVLEMQREGGEHSPAAE